MHSITKRHVRKNLCSGAASFKMAACCIPVFETKLYSVFSCRWYVQVPFAYFPSELREGFNRLQVHQASALYAFTGLLTVFIAGD